MEYNGKTIIAWLTYNENYIGDDINRVLYVFPRYIKQPGTAKNSFDKIPDESSTDRIAVYLPPGGKDAKEEYTNYGSLVEIKFNEEPNLSAKSANDTRDYFTIWRINIDIERFHTNELIQLIAISDDFEAINIKKEIKYPQSLLFTNELLINANYLFYGPFEFRPEGENLLLLGKKQYRYFIRKYTPYEINRLYMPITDDKGKTQILFIQKHILPDGDAHNRLDWMGDEELAEKLKSILKTVEEPQKYTKRDIKQISAVVSSALALNDDVELTEERQKRLLGLFDRVIRQDDFVNHIVGYLIANQDLFDVFVSLLREGDFKKIEEKNAAFGEIRERLTALQSEQAGAERRLKRLQEEIQQLKNMEGQLNLAITHTLTEFSSKERALIRAIDSRWIHEILHTAEPEPGRTEPVYEAAEPEPSPVFDIRLLVKSEGASGNAVIERVGEYIKASQRSISRNDVVNYMICIMQGFITTFAGEPGTGKTSLCTILAKSLGLARSDASSRFIDISVERGWTSHKDFIGYYNPLTKQMEKSNNEIFDAFARLNSECTNPVDAPFFILLDEANLSPIEHYWAAFLKLCDPDSPHSRSLVLGGNHVWKIPEHLRFLATVNFDHTTEELSPRFLDRSWIITLNPDNIQGTIASDYTGEPLDSIIPFSALNAGFLYRGETGNPTEISGKWDRIQRIFQSHSVPIMPRNQKMVRSYYSVACRYMERGETPFTPLDYAVSQKILPIINGTGKQYQTLLTDLQEECKGMPLCEYHIGRILKAADENMGFYQFFAK